MHTLKKVLATTASFVVLALGGQLLAAGATTAAPAPQQATVAPAASTSPAQKSVARESVAQKGRYRVPEGAFFNNPRGGWPARLRIERQVVDAIDNTKRGSAIHIALYSFDRIPVARRLIAARDRGVKVQILLNDHQDTKAMKLLRARLGSNRTKANFIYKCKSGCRTDQPKRLLHSKFYLFSKTGGSKDAVFVGSHNLTMNAAKHQWNDLFLTAGDAALYNGYLALFEDMTVDYDTAQPPFPTFCGAPASSIGGNACDDSRDWGTTVTFPRLVGPKNDPIVNILNKVQCITVLPDGTRQRTKLAVNMHTIRGNRGDYLADAYVQKFAQGCQARFSFGLVGFNTKGHLARKTPRGRMPLRSTSFDYHPDSSPVKNPDGKLDLSLDYYSHQKFIIIQGNYNGDPNANLVFTGSSNWGALGAYNDEVLAAFQGKKVARQYMRQFDFEWRPGNSRNAYTTTYTKFRGEPEVTVRPEFVWHKGVDYGPHWEDD
ncbi:phospholipase D-like domain-containing protein [Nocardioides flavescens]|uniref:phospholipase D n=1 Tax=Nocardioides flavescens TaxID=2691959 RepID=A0A6L7EXJ0_9ACTN|nr:hypothetical protein [Nocardioides flavescens]